MKLDKWIAVLMKPVVVGSRRLKQTIMASFIMNHELDSSVIKALRLLHSSDSDSENQLKQLWKQSVLEKYGSSRVPTSVLHKIRIPTPPKRLFHQENFDWETEQKKLKPEYSSMRNTYSSYSAKDIIISSSSDSDEDTTQEIFTVDGICMKCKTSFSLNNNKLVECVGCQKHYHQQCHFPPIRDTDLSDPRFVWYCFSCEENITITAMNERSKNTDSWNPDKSSNFSKNGHQGSLLSNKISNGNNNKLTIDNTKQATNNSNMHDAKKKSMKKHSSRKFEKRKHMK